MGIASNGTIISRAVIIKVVVFSIVEVKGIEAAVNDSNRVIKNHEDNEENEISRYYSGYYLKIGGIRVKTIQKVDKIYYIVKDSNVLEVEKIKIIIKIVNKDHSSFEVYTVEQVFFGIHFKVVSDI